MLCCFIYKKTPLFILISSLAIYTHTLAFAYKSIRSTFLIFKKTMYAETELMFPYFNTFYQDFQQIDEFGCSQKTNASQLQELPSSLMQTSAISDYYLGGGDLFNAPEPVIQEPLVSLDPMADLDPMSMISCGEDVISAQSLTMSDIDSSIENGQLLSDVFYECKKDILAKEGNETALTEVLNMTFPTGENMLSNGIMQKSASSSCLRSLDCIPEAETPLRPNFLDFPVMDFGAVYGMRRAFSEGDIKTLGKISDNTSHVQSNEPTSRKTLVMSSCTSEDRKEKLSRYWNKKSKRNFGRKIKYACRKALADNQPRVRGRFAKTE